MIWVSGLRLDSTSREIVSETSSAYTVDIHFDDQRLHDVDLVVVPDLIRGLIIALVIGGSDEIVIPRTGYVIDVSRAENKDNVAVISSRPLLENTVTVTFTDLKELWHNLGRVVNEILQLVGFQEKLALRANWIINASLGPLTLAEIQEMNRGKK